MRAILLKQAVLAAAGALVVASCAYEHPGPSSPPDDNALPSASGAAPAATVPLQAPPVQAKATPMVEAPPPSAPAPGPEATAASDAPQEHSDADADSDSSFDNLDIIDDRLKGKLAILRVGSQPTENNLLSVFAGLKNKTAYPLALEVQTLYKDKVGNPLNTGSWIPMTLKPHEETEYRSASISEDAVDFLIRIRRPPEIGGGTWK